MPRAHEHTSGAEPMSHIRSNRRGRSRAALGLLLLAATGVTACDFLDPTQVENPRTTADDLADAENPTASLVPGLRAQLARLVSSAAVLTETVSDNFSIHGTGLSKSYDSPANLAPPLLNTTSSATGLYWNAQELAALATFVIEDIAPDDETASAEDIAEAHYHRGLAYLILGENFAYAPVEEDGAPLAADAILDLAIADFGQAGTYGTATDAALARAHRWKGDQGAASAAAQAVLAADADFLQLQGYDAQTLVNQPWNFLVQRALQEMQPLPRLDFLDPKYVDREQGIAVAKAEEMHLILAEIALVNGDLPAAGNALRDAIDLAQSRPTTTFDDGDLRTNGDLSLRPRDAVIEVRADAASPYRTGLVLQRPGVVTQSVVSGSSLDADSVAALATASEMWHAFHLARQEILFLEGRRMADLGIRLPMMLTEIDANPNVANGDSGTMVVVPAYIPAGDDMDLYTPALPYDGEDLGATLLDTQITILFDMNRILADNTVSPFN
jgi:hypothetical protein